MHIHLQEYAVAGIVVVILFAQSLGMLDVRHGDYATILVADAPYWRAAHKLVKFRTLDLLHNGARHKPFGYVSDYDSAPLLLLVF